MSEDNTERMAGMAMLEQKVDSVIFYLKAIHGGEDINGLTTEGSLNMKLRKIDAKLEKQNGSVASMVKEIENMRLEIISKPCDARLQMHRSAEVQSKLLWGLMTAILIGMIAIYLKK
ncbi:MAG: hypothetical protein ACHP6H_05380 [Legionellales bacterium]